MESLSDSLLFPRPRAGSDCLRSVPELMWAIVVEVRRVASLNGKPLDQKGEAARSRGVPPGLPGIVLQEPAAQVVCKG